MNLFSEIQEFSISSDDRLLSKAERSHFRDALAVTTQAHELTPSQLQHAIFAYMPKWVHQMMSLRNKLVKLFGFEVGTSNMTPNKTELEVGDTAGFVTVVEKYDNEIISYAEDRHMAFYLSVAKHQEQVVVSTLVNKKTLIGKIYVNAILPFHHFIARAVIHNALKSKRI